MSSLLGVFVRFTCFDPSAFIALDLVVAVRPPM
jgi:hypothetical protein